MFKSSGLETDKDILRATKQFLKTTIQKKDTDNLNIYKANANPKINIPMSENIGQRRQKFSLEHFDALYYHHFQPNKFKIIEMFQRKFLPSLSHVFKHEVVYLRISICFQDKLQKNSKKF